MRTGVTSHSSLYHLWVNCTVPGIQTIEKMVNKQGPKNEVENWERTGLEETVRPAVSTELRGRRSAPRAGMSQVLLGWP